MTFLLVFHAKLGLKSLFVQTIDRPQFICFGNVKKVNYNLLPAFQKAIKSAQCCFCCYALLTLESIPCCPMIVQFWLAANDRRRQQFNCTFALEWKANWQLATCNSNWQPVGRLGSGSRSESESVIEKNKVTGSSFW